VILGLILVTQPSATVVALTIFLEFYWLITDLLGLVQVFVDRSTPWIWSLLSGIVASSPACSFSDIRSWPP